MLHDPQLDNCMRDLMGSFTLELWVLDWFSTHGEQRLVESSSCASVAFAVRCMGAQLLDLACALSQ